MDKRPAESSDTRNGVNEPLQRLASFKGPRDLSLGGIKLSKKVFAPNLNVARNKNKAPVAGASGRDKKEEKSKSRERRGERFGRNGPNIIQSAGVFSEGMAASVRRGGHAGGGSRGGGGGGRGGGGGDTAVLQKPTIRPNDTIKVDQRLEEECIRRAAGGDLPSERAHAEGPVRCDHPVTLPIAHFRRLNVQPKHKVLVKAEPAVDDPLTELEQKPLVDVKTDVFEEKDIFSLLQCELPTLILVQLPDSMPGRGDVGEEPDAADDPVQVTPPVLGSLAEGRVGTLRVHRSGRVHLALGDTHFEVIMGTKAMHHQEVVSVSADPASRSARVTHVGALHHKLTVVPHWETLLQRSA